MFENKVLLITGGTGSFGHRYVSTLIEKYKLFAYSEVRDGLSSPVVVGRRPGIQSHNFAALE